MGDDLHIVEMNAKSSFEIRNRLL